MGEAQHLAKYDKEQGELIIILLLIKISIIRSHMTLWVASNEIGGLAEFCTLEGSRFLPSASATWQPQPSDFDVGGS